MWNKCRGIVGKTQVKKYEKKTEPSNANSKTIVIHPEWKNPVYNKSDNKYLNN